LGTKKEWKILEGKKHHVLFYPLNLKIALLPFKIVHSINPALVNSR